MNEIYPIAKLGNQVLIINKEDLPYIGKERAMEVKCVLVDLEKGEANKVLELEKHLKFNPWEEMSEDERSEIFQALNARFSDMDILKKIIEPLIEYLIEPRGELKKM